MSILLAQLVPFAELFAQVKQNQPGGGGADAGAGAGILGILGMVCYVIVVLAISAVVIASYWKIFSKAGEPGWAAIVPVYNIIVLCKICDKPIWWAIVMFLCACAAPIFHILLMIELAKRFGKEIGFAIGLILLGIVFLPMLAFGSAQYIPPETAGGGYDDEDRPRRRRPRDDEDDEDRPRRRRPRDDDDDDR